MTGPAACPAAQTSPLRDLRPRSLFWQGAVDGGEGDFRWVIRHKQQQGHPTWCWAACVRNALSCFAVEVPIERIVDAYQRRFRAGGPVDDQRIPPERILPLWVAKGFSGARHVERPLEEAELQRELRKNGPVELLLWPDGRSAVQHLVLVTGFQTVDGATSYRVSDPLDPAETPGHPYEGLRGGLRMGRWRQTFTGLEYRRRNALRRRVKLAPPDQPPTGAPREPMFGSSRLRARDLCAPIFFGNEMFSALSGYRYSKWRQGGAPEELCKTLWLGESLPVVSHRGKLDPKRALREQWTPSGWSSVVYLDGRERYYVRSEMREDGDWYSRWVGEKYARALASGLRALSKTAGEEEEVQVVRIDYRKAYRRIYLLRLVESDRYLVVHVRGRERPLNGLLEAEELAERLARNTPWEFAEGLTEIDDDLWGEEPTPALPA